MTVDKTKSAAAKSAGVIGVAACSFRRCVSLIELALNPANLSFAPGIDIGSKPLILIVNGLPSFV